MVAIRIVLTLLVSAFIGYMTNFVAVKMLFRPLKPVYIKGHRLPFTPGIIPNGKPRLAKALGNAVSETLLTDADIEKALLSDEIVTDVSNEVCTSLFSKENESISSLGKRFCGDENYEEVRLKVQTYVAKAVISAARKADIGSVIISEGTSAIKEKVAGTMMAMFVTDELISSMAAPIGEKINDYIDTHGEKSVSQMVETEISKLENYSVGGLMSSAGFTSDKLSFAVKTVYTKLISDKLGNMLKAVNLNKIVEDKVNEMDVLELEKLVMSVMKNELNAIINLGALIGVIIGILNVLIGLI